MSVLVDTPVWSALFRRTRATSPEADRLRELIQNGRAQIIGPIRQEVLSGVRVDDQFIRLRDALRAFPDHALTAQHYERAAEFFNACRSHGLQGSNTDFLICAATEAFSLSIFTTDADFNRFAKYLPIKLFS